MYYRRYEAWRRTARANSRERVIIVANSAWKASQLSKCYSRSSPVESWLSRRLPQFFQFSHILSNFQPLYVSLNKLSAARDLFGCSLLPNVRTGSGAMQPRRDADQSQLSGVEVKNEWSYSSNPPITLHGAGRDNFTFFYLQIHTH